MYYVFLGVGNAYFRTDLGTGLAAETRLDSYIFVVIFDVDKD